MTKPNNEIDEQGTALCKAGIESQNFIVPASVPSLILPLAAMTETKISENPVFKTNNPFIVH